MRLYRVEGVTGKPRFAGSMDAARAERQNIVDNTVLKKRDVEIREVDVPTDKQGLIAFLNALASEDSAA